jgi:hypothetical protein
MKTHLSSWSPTGDGWGEVVYILFAHLAWPGDTRAGPMEVAQDWALSLALPEGDNLTL